MGINISNQPMYEQRASALVGVQSANSVKHAEEGAALDTKQAVDSASGSKAVEREKLDSAVAQLNNYVQSVRRELQFSVHDDSGRTVIKVLDRDSGEIIRQIPSEEALDVIARLPGDSAGESEGQNPLLFNDLA